MHNVTDKIKNTNDNSFSHFSLIKDKQGRVVV